MSTDEKRLVHERVLSYVISFRVNIINANDVL